MSQEMKKVVLALLAAHGLKEAFEAACGGEFHVRFDNEPYMALVIEKIASDQVSVAHYGEQNGDLMKDPEIVFSIRDDQWLPASFENSYRGVYQEAIFVKDDGKEYCRPRLLQSLKSFAATWARNIRAQGWLKDKVKVESYTHQHLLDARLRPPAPAADVHLEADYEDRNGCGYDGE